MLRRLGRRQRQVSGIMIILILFILGIILSFDTMNKLKLTTYNSPSSIGLDEAQPEKSDHQSFFGTTARNNKNVAATTPPPAASAAATTTVITGDDGYHDANNNDIFLQRIDEYFSSPQIVQMTSYYEQEQNPPLNISWIKEYISWHSTMRQLYPEITIFNFNDELSDNSNENKPKITIVYMDPSYKEGGLTDRFKGLGHLLWRCYNERRVLFLKWYDAPMQLESFLTPNLFNWTLPQSNDHPILSSPDMLRKHVASTTHADNNSPNLNLYTFVSPLGNYLQPFNIIFEAYFTPSKWVQDGINQAYIDLGLKNPTSHGRAQQHTMYDAVHLRIGHPAFRNKKQYDEKSKLFEMYGTLNNNFGNSTTSSGKSNAAHSNGSGSNSGFVLRALNSASRAIQCTKSLIESHQHLHVGQQQSSSPSFPPLYFFSDSIDLIRTVIENYNDEANMTASTSLFQPRQGEKQIVAYQTLRNTIEQYPGKIIGRPDVPIAHLEQKQSHSPTTESTISTSTNNNNMNKEAHKNTFVDLYIASNARCISLGIGRYAYMSRKISFIPIQQQIQRLKQRRQQQQGNYSYTDNYNDCWMRHALEADSSTTSQWGMKLMYNEVPKCPNEIK